MTDLKRSKAFYSEALAPLGISLLMEFEGAAGFGKETEHPPSPSSGSRAAAARRSPGPTFLDPDGNNIEAVCHTAGQAD